MANKNAFDVAILGGGLAGLTLAHHLMLHTQARVLLVEKRTSLPQKIKKSESLPSSWGATTSPKC